MITTMCKKLVYGKECVYGHVNENGLCIRYAHGGTCVRCSLRSMENAMDEEIELYYNNKKSYEIKEITEEQKKRRSEASMRWTAKNKEKQKEYQDKYNSKPEVKERDRKAKHEWYQSLSPEEKRAILDKAKAQRQAMTPEQKEAKRLRDLAAYHAKPKPEGYRKRKPREPRVVRTKEEQDAHVLMMYEKRKAEYRAKYASMTMEERRELAALNKARQKAKKEREDGSKS